MELKVAWGITGAGDLLPETIQNIKETLQDYKHVKLYVFLSKAAQKVVKCYGLSKDLTNISDKIYFEIDANTTEPFYYIPGALQLRKFKIFLVCPATANTVAKIVTGIADTLITNSVAQAAKANVPIYILPIDHDKGKQTTILPSGNKLELEMRQVDLHNTFQLSKMRSIYVFTDPSEIKTICSKFIDDENV